MTMTDPMRTTPRLPAGFEALRANGIEIDDSSRRRMEYSYDASNYRVPPIAVVFPCSAREVQQVIAACREASLPVIPRGGGTSLAGNSIGEGIVIDVSRYLRGVGPIEVDDSGDASVWVEPGAVLSELRAAVETQSGGSLTFAPDPSSHTRATVGGSFGNDACGNHSVAYGRMSDHVLEAEVLTSDGAHLIARRGGIRAADPRDPHSVARATELERELDQLAREHLAELRTELQTIPRQVSGYHLGRLLPESGFDVAASLAGSEGSCAVLVRARVRLVPKPASTALVCLGYDDTIGIASDVMAILPFAPTSLEGLDASIVEIMRARRGDRSVEALPDGAAYALVEFSAKTIAEAAAAGERLIAALRARGTIRDALLVTDPIHRAKLWRVREDGAGLLARQLDGTEAWTGWEDAAVAPERLADYLRDFTALLTSYGLTGPLYGHFGAGCVHVRIDFDFRSEAGREQFAAFVVEAAELVVRHGGSLSGEHGDGRARGQVLPLMYSETMLGLFRRFKELWDPSGTLNPGIMIDAPPVTENLALAGVPERTWLPTPEVHRIGALDPFVSDVQACIGVGRCRASSGGFMCPSYRATGDEKDSTRGRARVLQEMVRTSRTPAEGWRSAEVREALDLCLSCKACAADCPAGVDIAALKSTVTQEYYRGRLRPLAHYTIGWLPRWIPIASRIPALVNRLLALRLTRAVGRAFGIGSERVLPHFRSRRELRAMRAEASFDERPDTLIFVDSFTGAFRPEVVPAAARVLRSTGARVGCTADACCGLTLISTGQRDAARRSMAKLVKRLDDGSDRPIVVLEPSCASAIRDDAPELVGGESAARVAGRVRSFATEIRERQQAGWAPSATPPGEVVVQAHCHEHSTFGATVQRDVLKLWGVKRVVESSSCCGVAGNFGFERNHFDLSLRVAEHSIAPALERAPTAPVLTDGFSCGMQVEQLQPERGSWHLAQLLDSGEPCAGRSADETSDRG